jgi:hypothetical protein
MFVSTLPRACAPAARPRRRVPPSSRRRALKDVPAAGEMSPAAGYLSGGSAIGNRDRCGSRVATTPPAAEGGVRDDHGDEQQHDPDQPSRGYDERNAKRATWPQATLASRRTALAGDFPADLVDSSMRAPSMVGVRWAAHARPALRTSIARETLDLRGCGRKRICSSMIAARGRRLGIPNSPRKRRLPWVTSPAPPTREPAVSAGP